MVHNSSEHKVHIVISYDVKNDVQFIWLALPKDIDGDKDTLHPAWVCSNAVLLRESLDDNWGTPFEECLIKIHKIDEADIAYLKQCRFVLSTKMDTNRLNPTYFDQAIEYIEEQVRQVVEFIKSTNKAVAKVKTISVDFTS